MTSAPQDSKDQVRGSRTSWFTNKEWGVLVAAIAVVTVGITAAAMTPDDSLASAAASSFTPGHVCAKPVTGEATITAPAITTGAASEAATSSSTTTSSTNAAPATTVNSTTTRRASTVAKPTKKAAKSASTPPKATEPSLVSAGLVVDLGTYQGAPLRWRVLDANDGELLLLSEDVLTAGAFRSDWESSDANRYAASEVRTWLAGTFVPQAFNEQQRAALLPHGAGVASGDVAFLLTSAEVKRYLPKASEREAEPSAAAPATGFSGEALSLKGGHSGWWLADAASGEAKAQVVTPGGALSSELVYYADLGVRPALRVDRSKIALALVSQGGN